MKSTGKTRHKAPKKTRAGAKTRGIGPKKVTRDMAIPRRRTSPAKPAPTPSPTVAPEPSIEPSAVTAPGPSSKSK